MSLQNKKIAILSENGFEESELARPKAALEEAGATVFILSPEESIRSWKNGNWGNLELKTDRQIADANPEDYDALMLPGGVLNPDKLRMNKDAVQFTTTFFQSGKPLGAICHGPQTLIETNLLQGRKMTSYPSLKTDLMNAGVHWVDEEVVVDNGLVTSRRPADIPAFNRKLIEEIAEGRHQRITM